MRILIIGYGRVGRLLAGHLVSEHQDVRLLSSRRHEITVIESDPERCEELNRLLNVVAIVGDATQGPILAQARLDEQDAVVATTPHSEVNLLVAVKARDAGVPRIIARIANPELEPLFDEIGVTAVSPEAAAAERMHSMIDQPSIETLVRLAAGPGAMLEATVVKNGPGQGKSLQDLNLPEEAIIGAIFRRGELLVPRGGTQLQAEDDMVLIGPLQAVREAVARINGGEG